MATNSQPTNVRQTSPSLHELDTLLVPTATTSERVRGLLALGLNAAEIAKSTGVSTSALRNWAAGQAEPRTDAAIALDDLRAVAKVLLDSGLDPMRAAHWLRSRDPATFGEDRPVDLVRTNPMSVLAAAHGVALDIGSAMPEAATATRFTSRRPTRRR